MNYHPDLISTALRMLAALVIVLGGLLAAFYVSKRLFRREAGASGEKLIRIIGNSYIGVKKTITMVEIPGAVLVLGVTNDNISLLAKIEDKERIDRFRGIESEKTSLSFSEHLNRLTSRMRQKRE
ncbi:MAG TPA: hypothetical protein ENN86_02475 [Desulfobacteraceae bacterium]|nr:hypothetical protein [Desulfobacteraceae bacterium]